MAARYPIRIITLSKLSAMKNNNLIDTIAPHLTELMIQRIEHLETDWQNRGLRTLTTGFPATCAARLTGPGIFCCCSSSRG